MIPLKSILIYSNINNFKLIIINQFMTTSFQSVTLMKIIKNQIHFQKIKFICPFENWNLTFIKKPVTIDKKSYRCKEFRLHIDKQHKKEVIKCKNDDCIYTFEIIISKRALGHFITHISFCEELIATKKRLESEEKDQQSIIIEHQPRLDNQSPIQFSCPYSNCNSKFIKLRNIGNKCLAFNKWDLCTKIMR